MEYKYSRDDNYEDYASGRVIYGGKGIPNFPVRLLNEMFGRAKSYLEKQSEISVYDPCCGGGYALTVLGFFHSDCINMLYGSDIDENMVAYANKNTKLLTAAGLEERRRELEALYENYHKDSHEGALESIKRLEETLKKDIASEIFGADCTRPLPFIRPDIIITDVPYGNLVEWNECAEISLEGMMKQLAEITVSGAILTVCMDKKQKGSCEGWRRLEKQNVGKRKFEIYIREE